MSYHTLKMVKGIKSSIKPPKNGKKLVKNLKIDHFKKFKKQKYSKFYLEMIKNIKTYRFVYKNP